jgi:ubiquinone/menaquinone biosynthesis C-methylase UbiE
MMSYDVQFWDNYSDTNKDEDARKISEFIYNMCVGLGADKALEVGCNVGNNLQKFPIDFGICGVDKNEHAIDMACQKYPHIFDQGDIMHLSFPDDYFDVVFTRGLLIHIDKKDMPKALSELLRVSKRWVFNLEYHGEDGEPIHYGVPLWKRNMKEQWNKLPTILVQESDIPESIDKNKLRFTLVKKM